MLVYRLKNPPMKYIYVDLSNISNIDLTPYDDACELLKKFIELFVELNENSSDKRIMILNKITLKLFENTTEFTFPDNLDGARMIANLLNTIDYAVKKESIEDAIEFWRKYAKYDERVVPLLYNARSVVKLVTSNDVCYMINF